MMNVLLALLLFFQIPTPPMQPIRPPEGVAGGPQTGGVNGIAEEFTFTMPAKCFYYPNEKYANMPKRPDSGACRKKIRFNHVYVSPVYIVRDLTDEHGIIKPYDKTYAWAGDIVIEAPIGHEIYLRVAGRG